MRKILLLIITLCILPFVMSDTFEVKGCEDIAKIGINAEQPFNVYSPDCIKINTRMHQCDCINNTITLYSKDKIKQHDLIIEYVSQDVIRRVRYDDYVFKETYVNTKLNTILGFAVFIVLLSVLFPILIIYKLINSSD